MIQVELSFEDVPYELDVQEFIDHVRLMIAERYGVETEVEINDQDLVNILKLAQESKFKR